ncbi:TPA: hypothetical protein NKZ90_002160 [Vibrio parahaemolyticus]|nr:hypothetical protein [Vibrio parahaemolyticus]
MNQIDVNQLTPEIVKEFLAKMETKDDLNDILEHAAQAKEKLIQEEKIKAFKDAKNKLNEAINLLGDYDVSEFLQFDGVKSLLNKFSGSTQKKVDSTHQSKARRPGLAKLENGKLITAPRGGQLQNDFKDMSTDDLNKCVITHARYDKESNTWDVWNEGLGDKPDWVSEKTKVTVKIFE